MSDNAICPYCSGYLTTAGFMHSAGCPMIRSTTTYYNVPLVDEQTEIARLRAALAEAERKIERQNDITVDTNALIAQMSTRITQLIAERDDARKWARRMYRQVIDTEAALARLRDWYPLEELDDE